MAQDEISHERELGNGWTLWTEYKPLAEEVGRGGWYWALEREDDPFEVDGAWYFPPSSLAELSVVWGREENPFGPFATEEEATAAGLRFWEKMVDNPDLWERLYTQALANGGAWAKSPDAYREMVGPEEEEVREIADTCPQCGSFNLWWESPWADPDVGLPLTCRDCGHQWRGWPRVAP